MTTKTTTIYYTILTSNPTNVSNGRKIYTDIGKARKEARSLREMGYATNVTLVGYADRADAKSATLADYIGQRTAVLVER